jgi:hypothetical protein
MLRRVALVITDVSEELSSSFISVTRIGELVTLAVTSNRRTLRRNTKFTDSSSPLWRRRYVPPKRRFLQEPHGVTSQKTSFFTVTAVKASNLTITYTRSSSPSFAPHVPPTSSSSTWKFYLSKSRVMQLLVLQFPAPYRHFIPTWSCSQTLSIYVHPSMSEIKFHNHTEPQAKL